MSEFVTPRINAPLRQVFIDRTVRLIGKTKSVSMAGAVVDSSGDVPVALGPGITLNEGSYYEITGLVLPDLSIRVYGTTEFGSDISTKAADALVQLSNKPENKDMFY